MGSTQPIRVEGRVSNYSSESPAFYARGVVKLNKSFSRLETTCAFSQELEFLASVEAY